MNEKEFNLLHEPWILVLRPDGVTEEVSLLNLFRQAPEYLGLAGELPTQDVAVLRLLLAILHAVFGRYDLDGSYAPICSDGATPVSPSDALKRWKALWDMGAFPTRIIEDYLSYFEEHFYLFHPDRPFYQVAKLNKATDYNAAKLNGELSESNNKVRLFPQRTGSHKGKVSYSEAARWLLYVNAFDDTSSKPKTRGLPSPGAGWLGKLGLITAVGGNLYETLLLNLVFLKDSGKELWADGSPTWEAETAKVDERTEITMPGNPSALLTLQSRRLLLKRHGKSVIGYALLGGDFFPKDNSLSEQMTVWRNATKKKGIPPEYHPKRHDPTRQIWRDFSAIVAQSEGSHRPGIVNWIALLKSKDLILRSHFCFQTAAVKYGDKDFFVDDVFSDAISFNANLLASLGEDWVSRIIAEINTTEQLVAQVGFLAQNLAKAKGDENGDSQKSAAKEQAYFRLDMPFRRWLARIDPENDKMDAICDAWWEEERRIVRSLGKGLVKQAGPQAFTGRTIIENKKERCYTAPEEYNRFLYRTVTRQALKGGNQNV